MNILCLVKLVPDVENFKYDYERNVLVRSGVHQVINPEDATALALALAMKKEVPETSIQTVTMAPKGAIAHLSDIVRRGVDSATLISDSAFVGSDTYVTSRILARWIKTADFDCIFAGTHTLDGGTAHVPAQIAEILDLPHLSHIVDIDAAAFPKGRTTVDIDSDTHTLTFQIDLPAVLGFAYSTKRKLPYIAFEDLERDVTDRITVVTNETLGFASDELGLAGSPTAVSTAEAKTLDKKETVTVGTDDEGIETVYQFLLRKGFLKR